MCREKAYAGPQRERAENHGWWKDQDLCSKMQMTEKRQESRIIEQGNVFLRCIEKAVLFGTANGILQSLWS